MRRWRDVHLTVNLLFVGRTRRITQDTAKRYAGCRWFEPSRGSQLKRPCNPNRYGLDARPFFAPKILIYQEFCGILISELSNTEIRIFLNLCCKLKRLQLYESSCSRFLGSFSFIVSSFMLIRRSISIHWVRARIIIEFHKSCYGTQHIFFRSIILTIYFFLLKRLKERFANRIVVGIMSAWKQLFNVMLFKIGCKSIWSEICSVVWMKNKSRRMGQILI